MSLKHENSFQTNRKRINTPQNKMNKVHEYTVHKKIQRTQNYDKIVSQLTLLLKIKSENI